jgi:hypothetical protein
MILTSNVGALIAGEWRGAGSAALGWLATGLVLLVGAIMLVGCVLSRFRCLMCVYALRTPHVCCLRACGRLLGLTSFARGWFCRLCVLGAR